MSEPTPPTPGENKSENPYEAPAEAPPPAPPRPQVLPWMVSCGAIGAVSLGIAEFTGRIAALSDGLPRGVGGAAVGLFSGIICGRVIGRLLIARHAFRIVDHRRANLRDEYRK